MTNQSIFLIVAVICGVGVFFNGLRFHRRAEDYAERAHQSPVVIRRIAMIQMIAGPVIMLFLIAIGSGLLGPVPGIITRSN